MRFYTRLFKELLKRENPVKSHQGTPGKSGKKKDKVTVPVSSTPPIEFADIEIDSEGDEDIELITHGIIKSDLGESAVLRKPYLSRKWLDTNTCQSFHLWWDIECLKLYEIHDIYMTCVEKWDKSDQFDRIIIFIYAAASYRPGSG